MQMLFSWIKSRNCLMGDFIESRNDIKEDSLLNGMHIIILTLCQYKEISQGHLTISYCARKTIKILNHYRYKHMSYTLGPEFDLLHALYRTLSALKQYITVSLKYITRPINSQTQDSNQQQFLNVIQALHESQVNCGSPPSYLPHYIPPPEDAVHLTTSMGPLLRDITKNHPSDPAQ